jgi:hypothetical protein
MTGKLYRRQGKLKLVTLNGEWWTWLPDGNPWPLGEVCRLSPPQALERALSDIAYFINESVVGIGTRVGWCEQYGWGPADAERYFSQRRAA